MLFTTAPAAAAPSLATLQYHIVGMQLRMTPMALSVPKGVAGSVRAELAVGNSTNSELVSELARGAYVEATLRGPSFDARRIVGAPNGALLLPPWDLVGD